MNEEMLLDGLEDEFELDGLDDGLAAAIRRRAQKIRQRKMNATSARPRIVSEKLVKSIREVIKTDFYDTVYYDGVSEVIPFFVDPISKRHTVYRRGSTNPDTYAKTQAETNIRKPNELEIAQQLKVLGVSLSIYTGTLVVNNDVDENNNVDPEEAYEILGDTLFRIKIGETERFAVPTRHIPSGADLYGDKVVTRGVPNQKNYYSFGRNSIDIKVGESFRPEIVFQQNITAQERARLQGLKLALRFHTIFARPVA